MRAKKVTKKATKKVAKKKVAKAKRKLLERESDTGGHVSLQSLLPSRAEFGDIARWREVIRRGNIQANP